MKMNINMKKIVFFLLVQFVTLGAFAQEATIKEAEVAYTKEDYGKAIELYEGLLKTHGESAEIYYNLGNAYYKENKIAPAILNYERALLLGSGRRGYPFQFAAGTSEVCRQDRAGGRFLPAPLVRQGSEHGGCRFVGANRYCLFYPFYRLSDPVLLLQVDSFEEDRVLSGAGILGVGHLCQYLCRQPEGRADKPEERDRVCSDSDSEKFSRCKRNRLVYSA